ncbi:cytochrome ubiquinol oxidase subunit I [Bacillus altitudinis]|nr:cytochrome ubiquinol oxidase subunit I [Bacillus altitudinis]
MAGSEGVWKDSGDGGGWRVFANIDRDKKENCGEINIGFGLS